MADAPPARPGLFAGLAKILHLHQLPQAAPGTKTISPKGDSVVMVPPVRAPASSANTSKTLPVRAPIPSPISPPTKTALASAARSPSSVPPAAPRAPARATVPSAGLSSMGNTHPKWAVSHEVNPPHTHAQPGVSKGVIVTDYDRILDLVKARHPIKLDEIARLLSLKEELVAQELQTLEDNGLVDVKYPAFGEPLIYFKTPEA